MSNFASYFYLEFLSGRVVCKRDKSIFIEKHFFQFSIHLRERKRTSRGGEEGEGDRGPDAGSVPTARDPNAGLELTDREIMT